MLLKPKPIVDQSFDNRAEFFKKQIYGTSKGKIRAAVVWRDLEEILTKFPNGKSLKILDVGGGFGFMAQKLAALGHNVTVVDISSDMITLGKKELENLELSGTIDFIQGACQDILSIVGDKRYDLVMCHAVLEWLVDPKPVIKLLEECIADNGVLSLMFYNKTALLFQSLVVGNFDYIKAGLVKKRRQKLTPITPLYIDEVFAWVKEVGLSICQMTGVRIVHDYMRDKSEQNSKFEDLLHYELEYCRHKDFAHLGRYIHIWTDNKKKN